MRDQASHWAEMGPSWVQFEDHLARIGPQFGRAVLDSLDVAPGSRVLDVGCGTGATAVALAEQVGPEGLVVGLDVSPVALDAAHRRAEQAGAHNAIFEEADAARYAAPEPFDAVFSQFGVMFFPDPAAAFANLHQLLRPGGQLGFCCWQDLFSNEWALVPGMAVVTLTGKMPEMEEGDPGPFALADPDAIRRLLADAGFADVQVNQVVGSVVVPEAEIAHFAAADMQVGAGAELLDQADERRPEAEAAVRAALEERVVDGEVRLAAAANLVVASRP